MGKVLEGPKAGRLSSNFKTSRLEIGLGPQLAYHIGSHRTASDSVSGLVLPPRFYINGLFSSCVIMVICLGLNVG